MWAVVVLTFLKKWIHNSFRFIVAAMIWMVFSTTWMVFSEHNKKESKLHKHKKRLWELQGRSVTWNF